MNKSEEMYGLMSSDDSEDDDYNYLTILDNIDWKTKDRPRKWFPDIENNSLNNKVNVQKTKDVHKKPAVAVLSKKNRSDALINDVIASKNSKLKSNNDISKNKDMIDVSDEQCHQGVDDDLFVVNERSHKNVITRPLKRNNDCSDYNSYVNKNSNNTNNNKNKKIRFSQTNFSVEEVLAQKRANHESAVDKSLKTPLDRIRKFGKAFSPTVYSPEVSVASASTSHNIKSKPIPHKPLYGLSYEVKGSAAKESDYSMDKILAIILDWKPLWLKEFSSTEPPPPVSPFKEGSGLRINYESLEDYQSAYIPLLLYETWAQVYEEYDKFSRNESKNLMNVRIGAEYNANENFITISFQTVCTKNAYKPEFYASEGELIVAEINVEVNPNECKKMMVFGYITDFSMETISPKTVTLPGVVLQSGSQPSYLLKYKMYILKRPFRLNSSQPIQIRPVYYLKPTLRQIEIIAALDTAPLFKDILKPRHFTCQIVTPTTIELSPVNFNASQNRAILGTAEALSRPYPITKLLLIQGPPGTGKTHTLVGMIKHIYTTWEHNESPRILICAPSNGAVDEIARRLYKERRFLDKSKFKRSLRCVRVGQLSQIHPDVKKISLEMLIDDNADQESKLCSNKLNSKSTELEAKIARLDQEIANLRASKRKGDLIKAEMDMQNCMKDLQRLNSNVNVKSAEPNKSRIKTDLMMKSDIVLSTLNSCHQSPIEMLYRTYGTNTFNCVIVDEASQCTEPELLMPLTYKMTKMVLIGDPMQLSATVISRKANSLKLGRSLFERFYQFFNENEAQKSPVLMLNEQYRMHPHICEFPSNHFYGGKLKSSEKVSQNRNNFPIKPYTVFDITDTQENRNDPSNKFNELEAEFVTKLIKIIDNTLHQNYTVGIITPYNGQKKIISDKLKNLKLTISVEVNTVDGFQGQERDVIILSCVRSFDSSTAMSVGFLKSVQRMNVALTRAKYAMILCISGRTLESDANWKALIDDAMKRPNCRYKMPSSQSIERITKMIENHNYNK